MFEKLRRAIAVRHLAYLQRHNANQLAKVRLARQHFAAEIKAMHKDLLRQELELMCRSTQLAVRKIELDSSVPAGATADA